MSDEILKDAFYNNSSTPAWHQKGHNIPADVMSARQAHEIIGPAQLIELPLTIDVNGTTLQTGQKAIVQVNPDGSPVGVVTTTSQTYQLVTPTQACTAYDAALAIAESEYNLPVKPIETMGYLAKNKMLDRFFLTSRQGTISTLGDDVETYVLLYVPYTGDNMIQVRVIGNRVVCNNTLQIALNHSSHAVKLIHSEGVEQRLVEQIARAYRGVQAEIVALEQYMQQFALHKMIDLDVRRLAEKTYRLPELPDVNLIGKTSFEQRMNVYQAAVETRQDRIQAVVNAFQGAAVGYDDMPARLHGTAYMGWQSITDVETHRRGKGSNKIVNLFEGERYDNITASFSHLVSMIEQKELVPVFAQ